MTNLKSSQKVISFILAIALVLTMFVTVAPTNVMATGASGEVANNIDVANLTCTISSTSAYFNKAGYEVFLVGEAVPTFTADDVTLSGTGAENCTIRVFVANGFKYTPEEGTSWLETTDETPNVGSVYYVIAEITAKDGYQLVSEGEVVSKHQSNALLIGHPSVNSNNEIEAIYTISYNSTEMPTYKAGVTIPTITNTNNKAFRLSNAEIFPYTVSTGNAKLLERIDTGWKDTTDTTFVAGKTYAIGVFLTPKTGFTFSSALGSSWIVNGNYLYLLNLGVCPAKTTEALSGQLATVPAVTSVTDLTDYEQDAVTNGATPKLDLDVKAITPPTADKTVADNKISEEKLTVAQYLDIDLNLVIGAYTRTLTDLKAPITVQITVPAGYRSINRDFYIIRVHDGVATKITPKSYNQYTGVLTFETDKFSTYALAYKDTTPTTTPVIGGGAPMGTTAHIHSFKYSFNKDVHWSNCSCGMATSEEKHKFNTNGVCTVCDYNKNDKTQSSAPVANPSTGGNSNAVFIFAILSVLLVFGTTNAISRKKHSK